MVKSSFKLFDQSDVSKNVMDPAIICCTCARDLLPGNYGRFHYVTYLGAKSSRFLLNVVVCLRRKKKKPAGR